MLKFENVFGGEQIVLCCANCGHEYLHHYEVQVYEREEDKKTGTYVSVRGDVIYSDSNMALNPSSRRNGISILLSCEQCPVINKLTIVQHKGSTLIDNEIYNAK